MELELREPGWLFAFGDGDRLELGRSVMLHDDDEDWLKVRQFIEDRGLQLVASQTYPDENFYGMKVEIEVYASPEFRHQVIAGEAAYLPVCLTPEMFSDPQNE